MMETFLLTFIPLFVAIDIFGVLPIYSSLTENLEKKQKREMAYKACGASLIIGILFVLFGSDIFKFLGISRFDFMVGGGILLLFISLNDIMVGNFRTRRVQSEQIAIVPLAMPLILGPASLTTLVLISSQHSKLWALGSLGLNLIIVLVSFLSVGIINKIIGKATNLAMAKIASLFLLAISVMMIRKGIYGIISMV